MKKSLKLFFALISFVCVFTFFTTALKHRVNAEEVTRIDLILDQEKFNYYFNVAFTEGELDDLLTEIIDVDDKSKYYFNTANTYIMYCYSEEVKDEYNGYYGTGDGTENLKADTTYCLKVLMYTDEHYFGQNLEVYVNNVLQDPLHNYSDTSYYVRYDDYKGETYGIEFKISLGQPSKEKIVTKIETSELEKQVVKGESETFTAEVFGTVDDKSVDWTILGHTSDATIVSNGIITIGEDETAEEIILRAAAHANISIYKDITLYILDEAPSIDSVALSTGNTNRNAGDIFLINSDVTGNHLNKEVDWTITGANSLSTVIDEYGYVTIAIDETSTQLTITAASKADPSKHDSIDIFVTPAQTVTEININFSQNIINDYLTGNDTENNFQEAIRSESTVSNELRIDTANSWLKYEAWEDEYQGIGWGYNEISQDRQYAITYRIKANAGYYMPDSINTFKFNGEVVTPFEYSFDNSSSISELNITFIINATDTISITVQEVEGGTASANRENAIAGSVITLTEEADSNHLFKEWVVVSGDVEIINNKFILGSDPVVIKPVFVRAYTITINTSGAGSAQCIPKAAEGTEVIIDIYPSAGFAVKSMEVTFGGIELNNNVFTMGTEHVVINIVFSKILYLTITGNDDLTKGHVSASTDNGTEGTVVTLNPTPASGYEFVDWVVVSGGVEIENNQFTFGMEDVNIYAVFKQLQGISVVADQYGTASADMIDALPGTVVTLTATPNQNCKFIEWVVLSGNVEIEDNQFIMGEDTVSIKAVFKPIVNVTVINDGNGIGNVNIASGVEGDILDLSSTPNSGYVFKEWVITEGLATIEGNILTLGLTDVTIKAVFEKLYTITVTTDENGTASADYSKAVSGTLVTLTAVPKDGYYLSEWQVISGGITVDGNKFIVLENDIVIKAIFGKEHVCNPQLVKKVDPSCVSTGKQAYYKCNCGLCYEDEEGLVLIANIETWGILGIIDHIDSDWFSDNEGHWKECTHFECNEVTYEKEAHTPNIPNATEYDDKVCTVCGYVIEEALGHSHNYGNTWKNDENNHWKECACGDKTEIASHTPNIPNATEYDDKVCTVCGYVIEEALGHSHNYGNTWKNDENNHWKECACGDKTEIASHTPNIPNATEYDDKVCTVCGYVIEEALGHSHNYGNTWKNDEDNHWKECACGEKIEQSKHIDSNSDYFCDTCGKKLPEPPKEEGGCKKSAVLVIMSVMSSLSFIMFALIRKNR